MKRLFIVTALTLIFCLGFSTAAFAAPFSDISGHWGEKSITAATEAGYISGYPDKTFRPNNPITRAEFSKLMEKVMAFNDNKAKNTFSDLDDKWYTACMLKNVYAGILNGYPDGTIKPDANILREEAAVMLGGCTPDNVFGRGIEYFVDKATIPAWAKENIALCCNKGYFTGDEKHYFNSGKNMTRAEAVSCIMRYVNGETIVPSTEVKDDGIFSEVRSNGIQSGGSIYLEIWNSCILGKSNFDGISDLEFYGTKINEITIHGLAYFGEGSVKNLFMNGYFDFYATNLRNVTTIGYGVLDIVDSSVTVLNANAPTSIIGKETTIALLNQNTREFNSNVTAAKIVKDLPAKQKVATVNIRYNGEAEGKTVSIPYGEADTLLCFMNTFVWDSYNKTVIEDNLITPFNNHMDQVKKLKVNDTFLWSNDGWLKFAEVFDGTTVNERRVDAMKPKDFTANAFSLGELGNVTFGLLTAFEGGPSDADCTKMSANLEAMDLSTTDENGAAVSFNYADKVKTFAGAATTNEDIAKRLLCDVLWYDGNMDAFFGEFGDIEFGMESAGGENVTVKIVKGEI